MPPICLTSGDIAPAEAGRGASRAGMSRRPKPPFCSLMASPFPSAANSRLAQAVEVGGVHGFGGFAVALGRVPVRCDAGWIEQQGEADGVERQAEMIGPVLQRCAKC